VVSEAFIRASAEKLEQWTVDVSNKKMSKDDFDNLVSSQAILAKTSWPVSRSPRKNAPKS
jgi:hypothetical protein